MGGRETIDENSISLKHASVRQAKRTQTNNKQHPTTKIVTRGRRFVVVGVGVVLAMIFFSSCVLI
jgi:hypothetical protein